jgi:N-acyl-D-aspartate/D-glutamate deacylase
MPVQRRSPSAVERYINRYFWWILGLLFLCLLILLVLLWQALKPPYDLIIKNGRVFDGERFLTLSKDVGIRSGKVATVGFLYGVPAREIIDARGRVVAPGFIDTHVHVEPNMVLGRPFRAPNFVKMGVTTVVTGNCGTSHQRLREILNSLDKTGGHVNIVTLVGHNTVREQVMGQSFEHPSSVQLQAMEAQVEDAMRAGAFGLSTGLQYAPGVYSNRAEVVALAEKARQYGGIYATHVRDEGNGLMASLEEAVDICKRAQIPLHVSHLKRASKRDWGKMQEALAFLDSERPNLPALTLDVYAYTRSSSSLDLLLPPDFRGMLAQSHSIVADPDKRKRLVQGMLEQLKSEGFTDYRFARIAWFRDEQFWGKDIPDLDIPASWREQTAWVHDVVKDRAVAQDVQNVLYVFTHGGAQMIYEVMDESDMIAALMDPHSCIGTDTGVWTPERATAHPRSIGNFPKIIGELVRDGKISLDVALRKMTLEPATIFGLSDRGRLQEGMPADLVVFDPDTVSGPADYNRLEDPRGIEYVLVNGMVVARYGNVQATFPGKVIRKRNEPPLNIVEEPPAPVEKSDVKANSAAARSHDVVHEDNKKRVKAAHTTRKVGKRVTR